MMRKRLLFITSLFFLITVSSFGQRFSTSKSYVNLYKSTGFGTLHDHIEIENNTSDTIILRWKQRRSITYPSSAWVTTLQDPNQWHNPVDGVDSADFKLAPSPTFNNKLVIGVDHQQMTGSGQVIFTLYEPGNPADSLQIIFDVTVVPEPVSLIEDKREFKIFPNPASDVINVTFPQVYLGSKAEAYILSSDGKKYNLDYSQNKNLLRLRTFALPNGQYLLILKAGDRREEKLITIVHD